MRDSHGARSLESYRFGVFDFDGRTLELRKAGRLIAIRPQPLKLLALLLARPNDWSPATNCNGHSGATRRSSTSSRA